VSATFEKQILLPQNGRHLIDGSHVILFTVSLDETAQRMGVCSLGIGLQEQAPKYLKLL
jgi:hypothetical protein